jgi:hypothetical protein
MDARAAVNFKITDLAAELDETASSSDKQGVLNYSQRRRSAEFHQGLRFPEIASTLETLGLDPELQRPVKAALHSEGEILDDQSLAPSGRCDFGLVRYFLMKKQKNASCDDGDCPMWAWGRGARFAKAIFACKNL